MYPHDRLKSRESLLAGSDFTTSSVTSSDYYRNDTRERFQNLRNNRFSVQNISSAHKLSTHSAFDLSNPDYLAGNRPRARSSSPEKYNQRVHIRPRTQYNHYEIPIPATLLRPPLISGKANSRNGSRESISHFRNVPDLHRPLSGASEAPILAPQNSLPQHILPPAPKRELSSSISSSSSSPNIDDYGMSKRFTFGGGSSYQSNSGSNISLQTPSIMSSQNPKHSKTKSMPPPMHSRTKSNISIVSSNDYQVKHNTITTNALLDFNELNEFGNVNVDSDTKSITEAEEERKGSGKKKHKFWFKFGKKKKNSSSPKKSKPQNDNKKAIVEDTESVNGNDKWLNNSSENVSVPKIEMEKASIDVQKDKTLDTTIGEKRLLADFSNITANETDNSMVEVVLEQEILSKDLEVASQSDGGSSAESSTGSSFKSDSSYKTPISNIYNYTSSNRSRKDSWNSNAAHDTETPEKSGTSFKNQINESRYQNLIRRNLLSSESANSSSAHLPMVKEEKRISALPIPPIETSHEPLASVVSGPNINQNQGFTVRDDKGYIVFAAESESLGMKASPISKRSDSSFSEYSKLAKENTVIRRPQPPIPIKKSDTSVFDAAPPVPHRSSTRITGVQESSSQKTQRDLSSTSSIHTFLSGSSDSEDPRMVYSPINDTFSLTSHKNSSVESISTLEGNEKDVTFSGGYDTFTNKAETGEKYEKIIEGIIEKENLKILSETEDSESVYSELDSELVINNEYSLVDETLQEAVYDESETQTSASIRNYEKLTTNSYGNANEVSHRFEAFEKPQPPSHGYDYESLIGDYANEYSESVNSDYAPKYSPSFASEEPTNKSLDLLHYYEINSSKSTFRNPSNYSFSNFRNGASNDNTGHDSRVGSESRELRVINSTTTISSLPPVENNQDDKRYFSFATSIASDIQFQQNIAAQGEIQDRLIEDMQDNQKRVASISDSSVLYYSDSDLVHNPIFPNDKPSNSDAWESVSESTGVSGGSTLLSAVNSLYGDHIHKQGYKNIEDLCHQKSMTLQDAIKQIKMEKGEFNNNMINPNRQISTNTTDSYISYDHSNYTSSIRSLRLNQNTNSNNPASVFSGKRKPLLNENTAYSYSYMNI
ncbi:hypothetical protein DASC09_043770 [Saccharomycopsis crataegensis]|uniref:Uncharacterized protein n=1 Tax=Saccharomycopsis crataegensis TaxID=43959 RepID=A0AAV5QR41_9ASCO|nr:hypothetical protein DASC09_043770 [Saccharomycopsis crataegensis]